MDANPFTTVGLVLRGNSISSILPGSSAEEDGRISVGDCIVGVAGYAMSSASEIERALRGPPDSYVAVRIAKGGIGGPTYIVNLQRRSLIVSHPCPPEDSNSSSFSRSASGSSINKSPSSYSRRTTSPFRGSGGHNNSSAFLSTPNSHSHSHSSIVAAPSLSATNARNLSPTKTFAATITGSQYPSPSPQHPLSASVRSYLNRTPSPTSSSSSSRRGNTTTPSAAAALASAPTSVAALLWPNSSSGGAGGAVSATTLARTMQDLRDTQEELRISNEQLRNTILSLGEKERELAKERARSSELVALLQQYQNQQQQLRQALLRHEQNQPGFDEVAKMFQALQEENDLLKSQLGEQWNAGGFVDDVLHPALEEVRSALSTSQQRLKSTGNGIPSLQTLVQSLEASLSELEVQTSRARANQESSQKFWNDLRRDLSNGSEFDQSSLFNRNSTNNNNNSFLIEAEAQVGEFVRQKRSNLARLVAGLDDRVMKYDSSSSNGGGTLDDVLGLKKRFLDLNNNNSKSLIEQSILQIAQVTSELSDIARVVAAERKIAQEEREAFVAWRKVETNYLELQATEISRAQTALQVSVAAADASASAAARSRAAVSSSSSSSPRRSPKTAAAVTQYQPSSTTIFDANVVSVVIDGKSYFIPTSSKAAFERTNDLFRDLARLQEEMTQNIEVLMSSKSTADYSNGGALSASALSSSSSEQREVLDRLLNQIDSSLTDHCRRGCEVSSTELRVGLSALRMAVSSLETNNNSSPRRTRSNSSNNNNNGSFLLDSSSSFLSPHGNVNNSGARNQLLRSLAELQKLRMVGEADLKNLAASTASLVQQLSTTSNNSSNSNKNGSSSGFVNSNTSNSSSRGGNELNSDLVSLEARLMLATKAKAAAEERAEALESEMQKNDLRFKEEIAYLQQRLQAARASLKQRDLDEEAENDGSGIINPATGRRPSSPSRLRHSLAMSGPMSPSKLLYSGSNNNGGSSNGNGSSNGTTTSLFPPTPAFSSLDDEVVWLRATLQATREEHAALRAEMQAKKKYWNRSDLLREEEQKAELELALRTTQDQLSVEKEKSASLQAQFQVDREKFAVDQARLSVLEVQIKTDQKRWADQCSILEERNFNLERNLKEERDRATNLMIQAKTLETELKGAKAQIADYTARQALRGSAIEEELADVRELAEDAQIASAVRAAELQTYKQRAEQERLAIVSKLELRAALAETAAQNARERVAYLERQLRMSRGWEGNNGNGVDNFDNVDSAAALAAMTSEEEEEARSNPVRTVALLRSQLRSAELRIAQLESELSISSKSAFVSSMNPNSKQQQNLSESPRSGSSFPMSPGSGGNTGGAGGSSSGGSVSLSAARQMQKMQEEMDAFLQHLGSVFGIYFDSTDVFSSSLVGSSRRSGNGSSNNNNGNNNSNVLSATRRAEIVERVRSFLNNVDDTKDQLEKAKQDASSARRKIQELERALQKSNDDKDELQKVQDLLDDEIARHEQTDKALQRAKREVDSARRELEATRRELQSVEEHLQESLDELSSARQQVLDAAEVATKNAAKLDKDRQQKITNLQRELDKANYAVKDLETELEHARREIADLHENQRKMDRGLQEGAKEELNEARRRLQDSKNTVTKLEKELTNAIRDSDEARNSERRLKQELDRVSAEEKKKSDSLSAQLRTATSDVSRLESDLASSKKQVLALEERLKLARQSRDGDDSEQQTKLVARVSQLNRELQEAEQKIAESATYREQLDDAQSRIDVLVQEYIIQRETTEKTIADLENRIFELSSGKEGKKK